MEETMIDGASEVYEDWYTKNKLWEGVKLWNEYSKCALMTKFTDIDVDDITNKVERFSNMANVCSINLKNNLMAKMFKEKVDSLQETIPVVTYLRNEALQERHWEEIFEILQMRPNLDDDFFTLNSLLELNVQQHKYKLEEIALKAKQELEIELNIERLTQEWKKAVFDTKQHKEQYYVMVHSETVNTLLEESLM